MPREITKHKTKKILTVSPERMEALRSWLFIEIEDALASRSALDGQWRDDLRMYEGVPRLDVRNTPIENAPNIEITLGAIACDSICAQATDLIFGTSPIITCRPMTKGTNDEESIKTAKALQRFTNWTVANEADIRNSSEDAIIDDVQLGTMFLYIPWVQQVKKTKTAKVITKHPKIYAMAPEDVIVPSGTPHDIQNVPFIALRFWKTMNELKDSERFDKWNLEGFQAAGAKDWVRQRREILGRQIEGVARKGHLYDTFDIYCYFDIDGDGVDEDLYIVWNHTGRWVAKIGFNPFDHRPIEKAVYQRRAHLFYGLGVLRMMQPYEEEMTEVHNHQVLNSLLANSRVWVGKEGTIPSTMKVWAGKVIPALNPNEDLKALQMADTYPSAVYLQSLIMQLADNRVGTSAMSQPRPSQIMGSRTPGITALSLLQQVNRRFTPAFDGMRTAIANAVKQCLYRYQERLLAGDADVAAHIISILGPEDGQLVVNLLRQESFDEHIDMELTASSASVNREADRQNAVMLFNLLAQYYQRTLELMMIASNPETPPQVKETAQKIASAAGEIIDRTIRTFDQVRDPSTFIVDINDQIDQIPDVSQDGLGQILQMFSGGGAGGEQPLELPFPQEGRMMG